MKKLFVILLLFAVSLQALPPKQKLTVFAMSGNALEKNKAKIKINDPTLMPAYAQLIKDADEALKFGPVSVMEKKNSPPSGDKHDYMSLAPYHWPDPSKPNGLPYMRKDGQTNPEVKEYKDKEYLPKLCEYVNTLALAWYFSGEKKYSKHAANLLRVWFLNSDTKMNPNLNYGQAIKGVNEGRGAGMIDTRHLVKLIDGASILSGSKDLNSKDVKGLKSWFRDFLNWMQTSPNGRDEMHAENNHGAWYDAQRLAIALYIDSVDHAKKIIENAKARLDKQMDNNGNFPKEMERTTSLHYTTFAMEAFFNIAQMAETVGVDFWNNTTPSGKSLKKAFDRLHPFLSQDKKWEGQQIKPFDFEEGYRLLADASKHWNCKNCMQEIKSLEGDKYTRLRLNLLY